MHRLQTRLSNATKHRISILKHDVQHDNAQFDILGTRGKIYKIAMSKTGMHCTCPDFEFNRLGPCKHILYTILRFFRITKNDLSDLLHIKDIDWCFISQNLERSQNAAYDDVCPICFDTFDLHAEKQSAHMCQTCTKLTHRSCYAEYQHYQSTCPFCRQ